MSDHKISWNRETHTSSCDLCNWSLAACNAGATFPSGIFSAHDVNTDEFCKSTFENIAVLQFLSVRALRETLFQSLKGFGAQGVLAYWARISVLGGVGGYHSFIRSCMTWFVGERTS